MHVRYRISRHDVPTASNRHHQAVREGRLAYEKNDRELHLLGDLHHFRSTVRRALLLLCLADQVWQHQREVEICARALGSSAGRMDG